MSLEDCRIQVMHLASSHQPIKPLACPARFERASWALEAVKMSQNNSTNNAFKVLAFGVASAPRVVELAGLGWKLTGIHRRPNGR